MFARLANSITDVLFPPRCAGCGTPGVLFCRACAADLKPLGSEICPICGVGQPRRRVCHACLEHLPRYEQVRSAFIYQAEARDAIHAFKYDSRPQMAVPLALLMAQVLPAPQADAAVKLTGVPMHAQRQAERGYNQAALLAGELARLWGFSVLPPEAFQRVAATEAQARLSRAERLVNLQDAFWADAAMVSGRRILVVDDVCTTGSTMDACAQALLDAGAQAVQGITFARAGL